jgi:hypothetical protein
VEEAPVFLGHDRAAVRVEPDAQDVPVHRRSDLQLIARLEQVTFEVQRTKIKTRPGVPVPARNDCGRRCPAEFILASEPGEPRSKVAVILRVAFC